MKDISLEKQPEFKIKREDAERLMILLQEAHYKAAMNNNSISQSVFINAYTGSRDAVKSVAAALLSIGVTHAPITETRDMIKLMIQDTDQFLSYCDSLLKNGGKVPGLGNSFFKGRVDPAFQEVNDFLRQIHFENDLGLTYIDSYAEIVNKLIHHRRPNKVNELIPIDYPDLFPNAALITAGITEFLGGLPNFENWFFITGRSRAFLEMSSKIK